MNSGGELLLVEDNSSDAEMTMRALRKNNIANKVVHVKDGAEAIDYIFAQGNFSDRKIEQAPRVVLLDLKMPKVNGIQVLEKVKSDPRTRRIPVVMLTSSKEDPDIKECYRLGANSYVVKPVKFEAFVEAVSSLGLYWMILNQKSD